jgi:anti-sigma B factor antagonist
MRMGDVGFPVEMIGGVPVVTAPEEIDITNAEGLRAALQQAAGPGPLVVDMTRTGFCDSAAIHALVDAHKQARAAGGQVLLAISGGAVPRIFEITGIDQVIPRFDSVAEALAQVSAVPTPPGGLRSLGG